MNARALFDINDVLHVRRRGMDSFEFPDRRSIFHSTRFGDHGFDLKQTFLMIVPLRDLPCAKKRVLSMRGSRQTAGKTRKYPDESTLAGAPVPREEFWSEWLGRFSSALLGCKARAASFFW